MTYGKRMVLAAILMTPAMAWAGRQLVAPAPALGDIGLIALGVGLLGAGLSVLRKR